MAHVPVPEGMPGITGLLEYRPETGGPIRALTEVLMRGPSTLTEAERERIAAHVSGLNGCRYCAAAHTAIADRLLGAPATAAAVPPDPQAVPASAKLRALLRVAGRVQQGGRSVTEADVAAARAAGATDLELHDTVLIAALFCLYNRYVDGLAAETPEDPAYYAGLAGRIVRGGYLRPEGGPPRVSPS